MPIPSILKLWTSEDNNIKLLYRDIRKETKDILYSHVYENGCGLVGSYMSGRAITFFGTRPVTSLEAGVTTKSKDIITIDLRADTSSTIPPTDEDENYNYTLTPSISFTNSVFLSKLEGSFWGRYRFAKGGIAAEFESNLFGISGIMHTKYYAVGGGLTLDTSTKQIVDFELGLRISDKEYVSTLTLEDRADLVVSSYWFPVCPDTFTAVCAQFSFRLSSRVGTLRIGGQHQLNPSTLMKMQLDNYGKIGGKVQFQWSSHVCVSMCSSVNIMETESPKIGLGLALHLRKEASSNNTKSEGQAVLRKPLKHRDFEVDLESRGKTQLDVKIVYSGGVDVAIFPQVAGKGQALAYLLKNFPVEGK
ncbi:Mitochondrial outer membrane protein porin [Thalictrum thalictroides]|uniref:Mitochondrial outer membrane protein porin n=1 Tax=Thalictrum thalictroides TaxID=46969 RepID=A0A7J6V745_THATH|nr:Mitochondrial outer membrane protein porin [Thalictrum thalictroides]